MLGRKKLMKLPPKVTDNKIQVYKWLITSAVSKPWFSTSNFRSQHR